MNKYYKLLILSGIFVLTGILSSSLYSQNIPCELFPKNNIWNTPIDNLPVDNNSSAYVQSIGPNTGLHPDFGAGMWNGAPLGIPYCLVPGNQPKVNVTFDYPDESDPGPYPVPQNAPIEGGYSSTGDRHILIVDTSTCKLWELYYAFPQQDGSWKAGSGAVFDLSKNDLRPDGWTSCDAAGLPILPGLARYEEWSKGEITHALRFTCVNTRRFYVWPARHYASSKTDTKYPPMGQRFRLKASFDISGYSAGAQIFLKALKKYGIILADNGSNWFITGTGDERWDNDMLNELKKVTGNNFEAVDCSSLMVNQNSAEAMQNSNSIEITDSSTDILLSPNPASDYINIDFSFLRMQESAIEILNIFGECVLSVETQNIVSLQKIDISTLPAGVYFLRVDDKISKFIKI